MSYQDQKLAFEGLSFVFRTDMDYTKNLIRKRFFSNDSVYSGIGDQIKKDHLDCFLQDDKKCALITDNIVATELLKNNHKVFNIGPEFYGIHYMPFSVKGKNPTKLYNCFINRICPNRQSWLYRLYKEVGFDNGYVNFNIGNHLNLTASVEQKLELFDEIHNKYNKIFQKEYINVRPMMPYRNFKQTDDVEIYLLDSMISLQLESYWYDNRTTAYSEKTFRALQLPRPYLIFATTNHIKNLKNIGFEIIDDIVDHSYDQEENPLKRQNIIMKQLQDFVKKPNLNVRKEWIDIAMHNQELLKSWKQIWKEKLDEIIDIVQQNYV